MYMYRCKFKINDFSPHRQLWYMARRAPSMLYYYYSQFITLRQINTVTLQRNYGTLAIDYTDV